MFSSNYNPFLNSEMAKHIKEQNNKLFKKYSNNNVFETNIGLKDFDLVKQQNNKIFFFNSSCIFIGLISFLAGYNFRYLIKRG